MPGPAASGATANAIVRGDRPDNASFRIHDQPRTPAFDVEAGAVQAFVFAAAAFALDRDATGPHQLAEGIEREAEGVGDGIVLDGGVAAAQGGVEGAGHACSLARSPRARLDLDQASGGSWV
jgi:hypothetical protein